MQITQETQNGIVNWNTFSVGPTAHVNATLPNSSAALLNRVAATALRRFSVASPRTGGSSWSTPPACSSRRASSSIAAAIAEEASKTFGTDSVAEDVEYGFAGEIGATPPMDHRIDEIGISLPHCVPESREGLPCK
jgi:hypothetical protein